jgi:hypothetical protein
MKPYASRKGHDATRRKKRARLAQRATALGIEMRASGFIMLGSTSETCNSKPATRNMFRAEPS